MPSPISNRPTTAPSLSSGGGSYRIQSGDTLSRIASRHGVTVPALVEANKATYPSLATNPGAIQVGWSLTIPNGSPQGPGRPTLPPTPTIRSNNDILMVGMNETAKYEAEQLRLRGPKVTLLSDTSVNDHVSTGRNVSHNLSTPEGATAFALTLGLPGEQSAKIADVLQHAGDDARDEFAQLAQVWALAEKGGEIPSRLIISGHNVGSGVWGDNNGMLSFDTLAKLTEAMPKAARCVEDLQLAACYSGGQSKMEEYRAMFPNVKTIWAYSGSAPGSYSGAIAHQRRWETATRGTRADLDRQIAEHTRKGENVAVWTIEHGYNDGRPPTPLSEVRETVERAQPTFERYRSGQEAVADPQTGELREFYNQLQRLLQHPELPASERPPLEAQRDTTIRLLYFSKTVAPKFSEAHSRTIQSGFEAVGLPPPAFGQLSRADALAQITQFEQALANASPRPAAAERLLPLLTEGLRDLKRTQIPEAWV